MSTNPTPTPLPRKLGLTGETVFTVRHAPDGFAALLEAEDGLGDTVWQQSMMPPLDVVIAFHQYRDLLVAEWPRLVAPLQLDGVVWIAWPKKLSTPDVGRAPDLTEALVRSSRRPQGWIEDKVCTIDDQWNALRFTRRVERLRPKDAAKARKRNK